MHQRDYILRMIEQFGAMLAELRRRILKQTNLREVRADLDRTASESGFSIELLRGFDLPTLHLLAATTGEVDPTRCWMMAEILYLDGLEAALSDSDEDAGDSLLKARGLFELLRPRGGMLVGWPEASERIAEIDAWLNKPSEPAGSSGTARPRRVGRRTVTRRVGAGTPPPVGAI